MDAADDDAADNIDDEDSDDEKEPEIVLPLIHYGELDGRSDLGLDTPKGSRLAFARFLVRRVVRSVLVLVNMRAL